MTQPIKLILTDIDGTILPAGQSRVSERCREAFHAAIDAGIHVGPASGRGISHVLPVFAGDEDCVATALATNGMQVYLDRKLIHEARIGLDALGHVAQVVRTIPRAGLIYFDGATPFIVEGSVEGLSASFPSYGKIACMTEGLPAQPPIKVNVYCPTNLAETRSAFETLKRAVPELDFSLPMAGFLNMTPKGWNKATAVDVICDALGIGIDEVCVFGDSGNDVEMLEHVPCSVAVAGASPEAKGAAAYVIGSCEDDAVAAAIECLATGECPF